MPRYRQYELNRDLIAALNRLAIVSAEHSAELKAKLGQMQSLISLLRSQVSCNNFHLLESIVIRAQSLFLQYGCDRLSYLFECIQRHSNRLELGYLNELILTVEQEFDLLVMSLENS